MGSQEADCLQVEQSALLEALLNKQVNEKSISRVIKIDIKDAVPPGENYASIIRRATLTVVLCSGQISKKSVIIKKAHIDERKSNVIKDLDFFKSEIMVYTDILKKCEVLMDEYQDTSDKLWCNLIGHKPYNMLVLEDLKGQNFKVADRTKLMDLNHASLVMHSLARLHGLCYVLLERGLLSKDDTPLFYPLQDNESIRRFYKYGMRVLSDVIQNNWSSDWKEIGKKLFDESDFVSEKLTKLFGPLGDSFITVCHGDCWTCNVMFKYCPYDETLPTAFKFLDFQTVHIDSYIFDLMHFFYVCVDPKVRQEHYIELLSLYQTCLKSTLAIYGLEDKTPTIQQIQSDAEKIDYYSFVVHATIMPMTISEVKDAFRLEHLDNDCDPIKAVNPEIFKSDNFKSIIQPMLKKWQEKGLF